MSRNDALLRLDEALVALASSVDDYLGRNEPLLAEVMEDASRALQPLRETIWQKLDDIV